MIKAILFDGGDVVYKRDREPLEKYFKELSKKYNFLNVKKVYRWLKNDCGNGKFNRVELFRKILKVIGSKADPVKTEKEFTKARNVDIRLVKGMDKVLKAIKDKGLKIGLLSDGLYTSKEKSEWLRQIGVLKYFDYVFTSYDLKAKKLYTKNSLTALKKMKLKPSEVILIGHNIQDFIGAMQVGIKTLSINNNVTTTYNTNYKNIPRFLEQKGLI